ncbi:hypothetical protein SAMN05192561_101658 [Halopenitus malekzadehii]|uniref:HTH domain protein n=1 Tax=Halopenitus malekzadehii TaxID=1267564 RepID=A0A1H6I276_9EURY|nr:hypothetical protein [Halopenitus malekzadehii]SEH40583.1 hypothetical protein SAMN05192561_101658 [Halopenitus malekzadehii]
MPESGLTSWSHDLSARERVRKIATTLTQPRSVEWIRDQAQVSSWQTAKDELEMLVEFGQIHAFEGDDGHTKYAPNYQRRYLTAVTELINDHTREELREEVAAIQTAIDEWKAEYGVGSRSELEATIADADADLDGESIRERNRVLREWERYADNKRLVAHALELYDDARSLSPEWDGPSNTSVSLSQ